MCSSDISGLSLLEASSRKRRKLSCPGLMRSCNACLVSLCPALGPHWSPGRRLSLPTSAAALLLASSQVRAVDSQVQTFVVPVPIDRHPVGCFRGSRQRRAVHIFLFATTACISIASHFAARLLAARLIVYSICQSAFKRFMMAMTWSGPFSAPSYSM